MKLQSYWTHQETLGSNTGSFAPMGLLPHQKRSFALITASWPTVKPHLPEQVELLRHSLTERGVVPFFKVMFNNSHIYILSSFLRNARANFAFKSLMLSFPMRIFFFSSLKVSQFSQGYQHSYLTPVLCREQIHT